MYYSNDCERWTGGAGCFSDTDHRLQQQVLGEIVHLEAGLQLVLGGQLSWHQDSCIQNRNVEVVLVRKFSLFRKFIGELLHRGHFGKVDDLTLKFDARFRYLFDLFQGIRALLGTSTGHCEVIVT